MDLRYYFIYFIIEDSVKEVLYGPEVLQHIIEYSVKEDLYGSGVLLHLFYHKIFCDCVRYYIYYMIENSVKEVLYGPEALQHLFHHPKFCKRGSLGPGVLLQSLYYENSVKEVLSSKILLKRFYNRKFC